MRRIESLDGLRAVAVALVFASHCNVPGTGAAGVGVDVFFVLSGFLITGILLDKPIQLGQFYLRRIRRLTPPLLIALALAAAFGIPALHIATAGAYLTDYARAFGMDHSGLTHTWSLSVEEHFYLVWPFAVMGLKRLPRGWWLPVLGVAYITATGWRDYSAFEWGYNATYYRFDTRLSGLVLGGLLAVLVRSDANVTKWTYGLPGAALVMSVCFTLATGFEAMALQTGITLAEMVTVLTIVRVGQAGSLRAKVLSHPVLVWLGTVSYGIYLFHYPMTVAMDEAGWHWTTMVLVALPITLAMAAISFYTVERPLLTRKEVVA